jgi:hypothetical protein
MTRIIDVVISCTLLYPWSYPEILIHILLIRTSCIIENREREEKRAKEPDLSDLPWLCTSTDMIHHCIISRYFNYYS